MTALPPPHPHRAYSVGELLVGGDYACADGDTATLGYVSELLAVCLAEPLRAELVPLIRMCHDDAAHAADEWPRLRAQIRSALRRPEIDSSPH